MFYPELKGNALKAYVDMVTSLKQKASSELGLSAKELIIRPLKPTDVELSNEVWEFSLASANDWNTEINAQTIDDNRFVGINGVFNNEAAAIGTQLRITREGSVARIWNIQAIKNFEEKVGYVDDPITMDQNTSLTLEVYTRTAATVDGIGLIGAVAEKRGMVINP